MEPAGASWTGLPLSWQSGAGALQEDQEVSTTVTTPTLPARVTLREFNEIFEAVKNWGRWGDDDERGTLNFITPALVRAAAGPVRPAGHDGDPHEQDRRAGQPESGPVSRGAGP